MIKKHECKCGETNPENFRGQNKGTCKKCEANNAKERYRSLPKEDKDNYIKNAKANFGVWVSENPLRYRLNLARDRARRKKLEFNIDLRYLEDLLLKQDGKCPYTNVTLTHTENRLCRGGGVETISIDRVDSDLGYVKGNIELVSSLVNTMKTDLTKEDFLRIVTLIYDNSEKI